MFLFAMPTTENTKLWTRPKLARETTRRGDTCSFDNKQTYHSGTGDSPASVSDALLTTTSKIYVAVLNLDPRYPWGTRAPRIDK
jgi:hypothetical protein